MLGRSWTSTMLQSFNTKAVLFVMHKNDFTKNNLTEILSELHSVSLKELLEDTPKSISDTYNIFKSGGGSVFINCFLHGEKINNLLVFKNNFPDIYPLGANHPMLIVNHFLCVGSRILLNFLFEKFMTLSEKRFIHQLVADVLVGIVQILCGQYRRHFSYDGSCDLYDNINKEVFNVSFVVIVKKKRYEFNVTG